MTRKWAFVSSHFWRRLLRYIPLKICLHLLLLARMEGSDLLLVALGSLTRCYSLSLTFPLCFIPNVLQTHLFILPLISFGLLHCIVRWDCMGYFLLFPCVDSLYRTPTACQIYFHFVAEFPLILPLFCLHTSRIGPME